MMATRAPAVLYRFGPFTLDVAARVLVRDGSPVSLQPKLTDTLIALVTRAGAIVTKEELMAEVWPATFVEESNLAQHISRLRKILGGDGEAAYIETVPRRGYRFAHPVTTVEAAPARDGRVSSLRWLATAAVVVIAIVALTRMLPSRDPLRAPARSNAIAPSFMKVTTDSRAFDPAISPDGKFVAYALLEGNAKSVWLKNIGAGGTAMEIMPAAADYRGLTFSPDGSELFFKSYQPGTKDMYIARVSLPGGTPKIVARNVWSDFDVSPDGQRIAFVRGSAKHDESEVVVIADVASGAERIAARQTIGGNWFALWDSAPAWSPDGLHVAICGGERVAGKDHATLFDIEPATGAMSSLRHPDWSSIDQVAWAGNASLVVVAAENDAAPSQIWTLDVRSGDARRITNDATSYSKMRMSAAKNALVVEQPVTLNHIWITSAANAESEKQLTFGVNNDDGYYGLSWGADDRVLFASRRSGTYEIWSMAADGSAQTQLTSTPGAWNMSPRATPDGRYIVFTSNRSGTSQIWRIDADGGHPVQLTRGQTRRSPDISPDGLWVYCTNMDTEHESIERVSIDGTRTEQVRTSRAASTAFISPDGRSVVYGEYDDQHGWRTALMNAAGGTPSFFDWQPERGIVHWAGDARSLFYADRAMKSNLWRQPIGGGQPQRVTNYKDGHIWNFAVANDGRIAMHRGTVLSDIVLIRDFPLR
jgi:Tol biopolymer transport system component/DNA-binding winged helix-turn-helix (wHTH) protein